MPVSPFTIPFGLGGGDEDNERPGNKSSSRNKVLRPKSRKPNNVINALFSLAISLSFLLSSVSTQDILSSNNFIADHHHKFGCGCMEYWTCITR